LIELFVPGRLCLFGEHSDWAGAWRGEAPELAPGFCLVTGTDQGLHARAARDDALVLESVLPDGERRGPERIGLGARALDEAARRGGFFRYAAGVAAALRERFDVGGLRLEIRADLPIGKGLSSSAALCVLVARAFSRLYGLALSTREEMEWAYAGERRAGSACGRMDQVCAFGPRPVLMRFDGDALDLEPVAPGAAFPLLVVDLRRGKDTRRILADLNACFPRTAGALAAGVRDALGPRNAALVAEARRRLEAGDVAGLGQLMTEAQALFDASVAPACPELRAPALHAVLAHAATRELAFGGKGVGSQGDGCVQLVARDADARDTLARRLEAELGIACLPLALAPRLEPGMP
jgi:galactokinase